MRILSIFKKRKNINFPTHKEPDTNALELFKKRNKLTNKELARLLGISETYISYYFNGKRTFGASLAIRISDKTGIPMRELYQ